METMQLRRTVPRWLSPPSALCVVPMLLATLATSVQAQPVGAPVDGYPNYEERLMLVAMNRARADPNNIAAGTAHDCSTERPAVPPLMWDHDASQAARFHCDNLALNGGGLSHDSYCTLRTDIEATNCDGSAACACESGSECWSCTTGGGCGTGFSGRMSRFGFTGSPRGENSAVGYGNSWAVVEAWMTESICIDGHEGHRNINVAAGSNVVGPGFTRGGSCWQTFYYSDYGNINGLQLARMPSGIHRPESGSAGTEFQFYANYYDAAGPPTQVSLVVDGACQPMNVELGSDGNLTFEATAQLPSGCHEYYFLAYDAGGYRATFPEDGSLTISVDGGPACGADYVASQMPADCECGDNTCNAAAGETCSSCEADCGVCTDVCGDNTCNPGAGETCETCEADCGVCPVSCGDNTCDPGAGESCSNCEADCGVCPDTCGDGTCDAGEQNTCPEDCEDNSIDDDDVLVGNCGCVVRTEGSGSGYGLGLLLVLCWGLRRRSRRN